MPSIFVDGLLPTGEDMNFAASEQSKETLHKSLIHSLLE